MAELVKNHSNPLYRAWANMKTRCFNPNNNRYEFYKNIPVCSEWMTFEGFYKDMHSSYKEGLSLDRIDNHGGYEPNNCRWTTPKVQANNTRNIERAKQYTYNGQTKTIRQWAETIGVNRTTLDMRLREYGWSIDRALGKGVYHS